MATINLTAGQTSTTNNTLTANTADTVNFTGLVSFVEIETDGAAAMVVTVNGTAPDTSAGAAGTQFIFPASPSVRTIKLGPNTGQNPAIKLKSTGTPNYSVTAVAGN